MNPENRIYPESTADSHNGAALFDSTADDFTVMRTNCIFRHCSRIAETCSWHGVHSAFVFIIS